MSATSISGVVAAVALVLGPSPPAEAQSEAPRTCVAEIDGAQFDDRPAFAGRIRPLADEDGAIVTRSLRCPYQGENGRRTELVLQWDEQPLGRFLCANDALVVTDGDPARARLEHPDLQAAVLLEGPDPAAVQAMEPAARIALESVPASAAPCGAGATIGTGAAEDRTGLLAWVLAGMAVIAAAAAAAAAVVRRLRLRPSPAPALVPRAPAGVGADAHPVIEGELDRIQVEIARVDRTIEAVGASRSRPEVARLADHLVSGARTGPLDALASAALIAHDRGRTDLAVVAAAARRADPGHPSGSSDGSHRLLAGRILELAGGPADGSMPALLDARRRLVDTRRLLERRLDGNGPDSGVRSVT